MVLCWVWLEAVMYPVECGRGVEGFFFFAMCGYEPGKLVTACSAAALRPVLFVFLFFFPAVRVLRVFFLSAWMCETLDCWLRAL